MSAVLSPSSNPLAAKYLRVNHAGEFGAVQIYRAQIQVGRLLRRKSTAMLESFLAHERRHLAIFAAILAARRIPRCTSYYLCGLGGYLLGLATALLGERYIMICTHAVETVVNRHLEDQLASLASDPEAHAAVASIVEDELEHRDLAGAKVGRERLLGRAVRTIVIASTEAVIWLGMRLPRSLARVHFLSQARSWATVPTAESDFRPSELPQSSSFHLKRSSMALVSFPAGIATGLALVGIHALLLTDAPEHAWGPWAALQIWLWMGAATGAFAVVPFGVTASILGRYPSSLSAFLLGAGITLVSIAAAWALARSGYPLWPTILLFFLLAAACPLTSRRRA
jgi:3-demethoxyubiquinol 3-hydroxylase